MHSSLRTIALLATLALLSACASGPRIVRNVDPAADFTQFRTFGFISPLGTDRAGATTLTSQQLVRAATDELQARGLRRADENPDLLVNFFISTREVISSRPTTGSANWRGTRYSPWRGYSASMSTPTITQSTSGTLAVDLVDASRQQLVWEGAATRQVTEWLAENKVMPKGVEAWGFVENLA